MWRKVVWISLVALFCTSNAASGFDGVTFGVGEGQGTVNTYRIAIRKNMDVKWLESAIGYLTVNHEFSINLWQDGNNLLKGIAWSPVFHYRFKAARISPFIELGIGLSYFSGDKFGGRNLSTRFLFEDRIMLGMMIKNMGNVLVGYMHYSNANIDGPNQGMSMLAVQYVYPF